MNNNAPVFDHSSYSASVSEVGGICMWIVEFDLGDLTCMSLVSIAADIILSNHNFLC